MLMINWNDLQSTANNDYSFHFISFHAIISAATVYINVSNGKLKSTMRNETKRKKIVHIFIEN